MTAALLLDPRLALIVLSALIIGAAVPLAIAWVRLLPEEAPPFDIQKPELPHSQKKMSYGFDFVPRPYVPKRSRFSMVLLAALSVCFALQVPGIPRYFGFNSIGAAIPEHARGWLGFLLTACFLGVPSLAIVHSFFKPNLLSIPLIAAAVILVLLWMLATPLSAALAGVS
jgi:hypothetical protein